MKEGCAEAILSRRGKIMTAGRRKTVVRSTVLAFILNLAALLAALFVLPVAARPWTSPAAVMGDLESTERGVLPASTGLRTLSRPRHDPVTDPPERVAGLDPGACGEPALAKAIDHDADAQPRHEARLVDSGARGPPASGR